jgi:predicted ester cyclase
MSADWSIQQNETIIRRLVEEIINKGDFAAIDEVYDAHFINHDALPGTPIGVEGIRQQYVMFRSAFPDCQETIDAINAKGDKIIVRSTVHGTHQGRWMGIAPTGKPIRAMRLNILRTDGGKIVEQWGNSGDGDLMRQLGAIPRAAHAPKQRVG